MSFSMPNCQLIGAGRAGRAISIAMARAGYRFTWIGSRHAADSERLFRTAIDQGMSTLKQDGIVKVFGGYTDLPEVKRVCIS